MRLRHLPCWLLPALALAACGGAEGPPTDDFGYEGTGIEFSVAPLTLDSLSDACYSFAIQNEAGELVVGRGPEAQLAFSTEIDATSSAARSVCASQFGNGDGGDISYVAPCDASVSNLTDDPNGDSDNTHTVTLWVDALCTAPLTTAPPAPGALNGALCTEMQAYVDPCPTGCTLSVVCAENADTPVSFNFTIMGQADQGFFDVAVNFDNVFCSAKLDTCHGDDDATVTPIALVHNPTTGSRGHTAVAAVACSAGAGQGIETALYYTDFVVTCGEDVYTLDLSEIDAEGNVSISNQDATETLHAAVFFGREDLPDQNKVYTNVAFILPDTGAPCYVNWNVIPTRGDPPPNPEDDPPGTFTQVSVVTFGPPDGSSDPGAVVRYGHCHSHVMNSFAYTLPLPVSAMANLYGTPLPSGVYTGYVEETPEIRAQIAPQESKFSRPSRCRGPTWVHEGQLKIDATNPPPPDYACIREITGLLWVDGSHGYLEFSELVEIGRNPGPSLFLFNVPEAGSTTLHFPKLERTFDGIYPMQNEGHAAIQAPRLTSIGSVAISYFSSGSGVSSLDAPMLQTMTGDFVISGSKWSGNLPKLETVQGLNWNNFGIDSTPINISLPALQSAAYIMVRGTSEIQASLPSLINVEKAWTGPRGIYIDDLTETGSFTLNAPSLTSTGSLNIRNNLGEIGLNLPSLTTITVPTIEGSLFSYDGNLWIENNPFLEAGDLVLGESLNIRHGFYVENNPQLSTCAIQDWIEAMPAARPLIMVANNLDVDNDDCEVVSSNVAVGSFDPSKPHVLSFAEIQSGTYQLGSPAGELGRLDNETQHWVELTRSFWMQTTEVTVAQWARLARFYGTPSESNGKVINNIATCPSCPVENVSWYSALGFANALSLSQGLAPCYDFSGLSCNGSWIQGNLSCGGVSPGTPAQADGGVYACTGYRLPTEAEWEYAARAGTPTATYRGNLTEMVDCSNLTGMQQFEGNPLLDIAHYWCNAPSGTIAVATKAANAWGLYDMLGNVWEWTWDHQNWPMTYPAGTEEEPAVDPYSSSGSSRVDRGGSWREYPLRARAAGRFYLRAPSDRVDDLGFRLSRTVIP